MAKFSKPIRLRVHGSHTWRRRHGVESRFYFIPRFRVSKSTAFCSCTRLHVVTFKMVSPSPSKESLVTSHSLRKEEVSKTWPCKL
eukprot:5005111-Amphidinium_carterae.1